MRLRCRDRKATENPLHTNRSGMAVARETVKLVLLCMVLSCHTALSATATRHEATANHTAVYPIDLPAQSVADSLASLSEQLDLLLLIPYQVAINLQANPVQGNYTLSQALALILQGTGFSGGLTDSGVIIISQTGSESWINPNGKGKSMNTTNSSKRKTVLAGLVGLFASGGMTQAIAQGDEAATGQSAIDEIIVTATKRSSSIQDAELSIAVLSQNDIERNSIVGMGDYLSTIPGVHQADYGVANNRLSMRGIGASREDETTVGVYLGEVSLNNIGGLGTAVDIKLVDMERVEVLRGPQGTLYGSGTMGGAVRNIPNKPILNGFEAKLNIGGSNTDGASNLNDKIIGVINIPLVENQFALRVATYRFKNQGYVDMVSDTNPALVSAAAAFGGELNNQTGVGETEFSGVRASLLWQPSGQFSTTITHVKQDAQQDGMLIVGGDNSYENSAFGLNGKFSGYDQEGRWDDTDFTNLVINYDLGWGDILFSSTVSEGDYGKILDAGRLFLFPTATLNITDAKGFSQELRFSSRLEGPFQFIGGLYYENLENDTATSILWTGDDLLNFFGTPQLYSERLENHVQQQALFGEVSYAFTEYLKLTLGGRWFDYDRRYVQEAQNAPFSPGGVFIDRTINEDGSKGKINLAYTPNDDSLIYVQWAQGFRLGRPIQVQPQSLCDVDNDGILDGTTTPLNNSGAVDSDNLDSMELGGKFTLVDNRVVLNAAVYHIKWEGIPVQVTNPSGLCGTVSNAGEAQSQGLEAETTFHISQNFRLGVGFSYINAELTADSEGLGFNGDRLPYTPRSNASITLDYTFELGGYDSYIYASFAYVGGSHTDLSELSAEIGDYGKLNLRSGIAISEQLDIEIYGTNLTNSDELTFSSFFGNYRQTPRQIGMDIRYRF